MNIFKKYGIRDIADVTFYSIYHIGGETYYLPVLYLDTLKLSSIENKVEIVEGKGAKGNARLLTWDFGRNVTLKLEDALFSSASMSMLMTGQLYQKLSSHVSAAFKIITANRYGESHYSTKAFPSPEMTEEEWAIVFDAMNTYSIRNMQQPEIVFYNEIYEEYNDVPKIAEYQTILKKMYFNRTWDPGNLYDLSQIPVIQDVDYALPIILVTYIFEKVNNVSRLGEIKTSSKDLRTINRMEKCIVTDPFGMVISKKEQLRNYEAFLRDDETNIIFYLDPITMMPFFNLNDFGDIVGFKEGNYDFNLDQKTDQDEFVLKEGQHYFKYTKTILTEEQSNNSTLGQEILINTDTFSGEYRIVGETYVRDQQTGADKHYQFTIKNAKIKPETNISLKADGDVTTFNIDVYAISKDDGPMVEIKEYATEKDYLNGGEHLVAEKKIYEHSKVSIPFVQDVDINNDEIY